MSDISIWRVIVRVCEFGAAAGIPERPARSMHKDGRQLIDFSGFFQAKFVEASGFSCENDFIQYQVIADHQDSLEVLARASSYLARAVQGNRVS